MHLRGAALQWGRRHPRKAGSNAVPRSVPLLRRVGGSETHDVQNGKSIGLRDGSDPPDPPPAHRHRSSAAGVARNLSKARDAGRHRAYELLARANCTGSNGMHRPERAHGRRLGYGGNALHVSRKRPRTVNARPRGCRTDTRRTSATGWARSDRRQASSGHLCRTCRDHRFTRATEARPSNKKGGLQHHHGATGSAENTGNHSARRWRRAEPDKASETRTTRGRRARHYPARSTRSRNKPTGVEEDGS